MEDKYNDYKMCNKLTEAHVKNLKKTKVSFAAQIFSARFAAAMKMLATHSPDMPKEAVNTAEFLLFMDKVFDSVNGAKVLPEGGKRLRMAVTSKSEHEQFWIEAVKVFETVKFIDIKRQPPSIKNWIHTLKGLKYLGNKLNKSGFQFLLWRTSLDPLGLTALGI
uniref:Uncharacterized protein LOC114344028 n=1 Tax=Diabrotica virgifera virgifera TaxID=50390 RepID=A0A6P7GZ12_DIAVI